MADDLLHAITHHARKKERVVSTLAVEILTKLIPDGWQVYHGGTGHNSWRLYKGGKVWYFNAGGSGPHVLVRNSYYYQHASDRRTLASRVDVIRWVRDVQRGGPRVQGATLAP